MAAIYTVDIKCRCTKDCSDFGVKAGEVFTGRVELWRTAAPLFIIYCPGSKPIKCLHHWFADYFELIQ